MSSIAIVKKPILEDTTSAYSLQLTDENGDDLTLGVLLTVTLTYYDSVTRTVINGRSAQDVLNANNVTVSSTALVLWTLQPVDTVLVDARRGTEPHLALFTWSWDNGSGTKVERHETQLTIEAVPLE